jgi:hypothetical protein
MAMGLSCRLRRNMRTPSLRRASVSLIALLAACSSGAAPPAAGMDGGNPTPGMDSGNKTPGKDSGTPPLKDGGKNPSTDGGQSVVTNGTYAPPGCSYTVTPKDTIYTLPIGTQVAPLVYTALSGDSDASAGPASTAAPQRVRLGLGGDTTAGSSGYPDPTTTAAFTWETGAANTAAKVKYGATPSALTTVQQGYNWTVPATGSSGATYYHEAHVCGLMPATTYYYQVGGGAPGAEIWSKTQTFTTVPASGPITIAISGDARDTVTTWQLLNERIKALNVSAHLFTGDLILTGTVESEYVNWLDEVWTDPNDPSGFLTLGQLLFVPINGNHEYDSTLSFANFAIPGDGSYAKTYASFDIGPAHFVLVDDNHIANSAGVNDPEATAQEAWITQDLTAANADRTNHPFIFVLSHRGMFSTSNHSADSDVLQTRTVLAPIYAKYNVDGVFNGHDHEYERTYPIVPGTPITGDPTVTAAGTHGTTYVICAGAGASPYAVGTGTEAWRANHIPFGTAAMTGTPEASYVGMYQTMTLTPKSGSAPATALVNVYAIIPGGGDGTPIDTFTLTASGS